MGNTQGRPVIFTDEVNLNHFRLLRVVGKGAFGKVRIVERKDTGLTFALKYIRKDEVVRSESVRNIIRERRMMEHLNHPFICNLRYSFQDIEYMYIVLDLMTGGDLRFHISRKTFTEEAVRFWVAELGCALRYVHKQGIIHRDVKPDNVLLDSEGHAHLADFNVASDFVVGKPLTSKSGTLAYLAPEVYSGKGYSSGADWWSLGVLFYECIYSKRPFDGSTQTNLGANIAAANPKFAVTSPPVSMPCLHAISSLLEADPAKRIGSASWHSFTDNPFFRELEFEALERKEVEPVFVPSSEKTNFDATYDLEELLLEEAPLEARARRQKPREPLKNDATDKEVREEELYRMIETMFLPFDYTAAAYDRYAGAINQGNPSGGVPSEWGPPPAPSGIMGDHPSPQDTQPHAILLRSHSSRPALVSAPTSRNGSPPIPTMPLPAQHSPKASSHRQHPVKFPPPVPPYPSNQQNYSSGSSRTARRPSQSKRTQSASGGLSVILGETESWSDLAQKDATLPADAKELLDKSKDRPSGMLGFLSRKRGRGASPKPMERGILSGKEGGRIVVSNG
ncbi:MAG: hypothetical protein M1818_003319 [Claussenomyces sp. TS43310]|nr:MAG: hypothetical protein M1818_003319 [Claussenomyces sp. TS43310]